MSSGSVKVVMGRSNSLVSGSGTLGIPGIEYKPNGKQKTLSVMLEESS